jgi:alkanesulfonate monooxygenase SsuD/methylene tetrahydromethanopterin reductase-like flavin-dependent oxidoreductase (luciferase family)
MTIRLGYQMPNFSYGTPVADLFPTVIRQVREAEEAGFDTAFVITSTSCRASGHRTSRCWRHTPR